MPLQRLKHVAIALAYLAVFAAGACQLQRHLHAEFSYGDESGWVRSAVHVAALLTTGDLSPVSWQFTEDHSFGSLNPPLGKLFFALAMLPLREADGSLPPAPGVYVFRYPFEWNVEQGNIPREDLLLAARRVSMALGLALLITTLAAVHLAAGPLAGIAAGLFFLSNPLFVELSTQVMTDIPYWLLVQLAVLALLWALGAEDTRGFYRRVFLASLACGFACLVKMPAPFLLAPTFAVAGVLALWNRRSHRFAPVLVPVIMGATVLACSLVFNPFLWPDLSRFSMQGLRADWALVQEGVYTLEEGQQPPAWITEVEAPATPGTHRLEPAQLTRLKHHLKEAMLARYSFAADAYNPLNVIPSLFAITRPVQFPLLYMRWQGMAKLHQIPGNGGPTTFKGWAKAYLASPREIVATGMAIAGLVSMGAYLITAGRRQRQAMLLLLFHAIALTALAYATRMVDIPRYLFGAYIVRDMLAGAACIYLPCLAITLHHRLRYAPRMHNQM